LQNRFVPKGFWAKEAAPTFAAGALAAWLVHRGYPSASGARLSDTLFTVGMAFFFVGLFRLIGNMGLFDGPKYGARCVWRLLRNKKPDPDPERMGYAGYMASRPKRKGAPLLMAIAALFIALAALALTLA